MKPQINFYNKKPRKAKNQREYKLIKKKSEPPLYNQLKRRLGFMRTSIGRQRAEMRGR